MVQSDYLCVILHVKSKKIFILTVSAWFPILDKIQDGDHVWWRHRSPAAPPLIKYTSSWRDQRLSTEGKTLPKYPNISKPRGGGGGATPPLLYHGGVMTLRVRPRVEWRFRNRRRLCCFLSSYINPLWSGFVWSRWLDILAFILPLLISTSINSSRSI